MVMQLLVSLLGGMVSELGSGLYPALFFGFFTTLYEGINCSSKVHLGRKIKTKAPREDDNLN